MKDIVVHLSPEQAAALNNALRREIAVQERQRYDRKLVGVVEYIGNLDGALQAVTAAWEKAK